MAAGFALVSVTANVIVWTQIPEFARKAAH
jgi:hypothetical protein